MQSGALWQRQTTSTPTIEVRNTGVLGDGSHDYRYPGFWVGAGTGVGLAYIAHRFCNDSDTGCSASAGQELFGTLFLTVIMGTFGALIGAQFER
ncbi:MAG TPA: hypothetical protein VG940_10370 [Gemmatimonadales bacterium]|nr:hypothetical protein [Gemmatimonadales bacterium]